MKAKPLLLQAFLLLGVFASCKKIEGQNGIQSPPSGKWLQTRLETYEDSAGIKLYDTIYMHPFTSYDFAQFNNNGTFETGTDHYYYLNVPHQDDSTQLITPVTASWAYTAISTPSGTKYVLSSESMLTNPGGFVSADTVSMLNSNTLWLHSVFYGHGIGTGPMIITELYYNK